MAHRVVRSPEIVLVNFYITLSRSDFTIHHSIAFQRVSFIILDLLCLLMPLSAFWWQELLWPTGATASIAIKLFQSSVFIVDNVISKHNANIADFITACLHRIIPISWQSSFRNSGGISILSDISVLILAATVGLTDMQLVLDMVQVSKKISRFQYGATSTHRLEVFRPVNNVVNFGKSAKSSQQVNDSKADTGKKSKILVFVHGGAWGCGQLWQYRLVANGLGNIIGATSVVLIGYPTYPTAGILEQRDCVTDAVRFIRNDSTLLKLLHHNRTTPDTADMNYSEDDVYVPFCNTIDTMVLCGHSSGANICALSLLDTCYSTNNINIGALTTHCYEIDTSSSTSAGSNNDNNAVVTTSGAAMAATNANTTPTLKHPVDVFIGLCGPYNLVKHYLFEERRGVHVVSPMTAAAGGKGGLPHCSPTLLAELLLVKKANIVSNDENKDANSVPKVLTMPHTILLHGAKDATVPVTSSIDFGAALSKLGVSNEIVITKVSC